MTSQVRVDVKWQPRPASTQDCAVRFAAMLDRLATLHPAFARWNKKAWSRAAANRPAWSMPPATDELTAVFENGRVYKDKPRQLWPEMGYRVSAWNGRDGACGASLSVYAGAFSNHSRFPNTVDLVLKAAGPDNAALIDAIVLKRALLSLATAWEPDYGVVASWDYYRRLFGDRHWPPFRSGWMTYLAPQYASRITPPPTAIVEPVPGGGLLLLATAERFSIDNPAHLAAADAIQAALAPLQALLPPSPHLPPRHNPAS
jgi:hypothetical protein